MAPNAVEVKFITEAMAPPFMFSWLNRRLLEKALRKLLLNVMGRKVKTKINGEY